MAARMNYPRPVELIIEDDIGREARSITKSVEISSHEHEPVPRWIKIRVHDLGELLPPKMLLPPKITKTETMLDSEERGLLQALNGEPHTSMCVLADWYRDNAANPTLRDRLPRGLEGLAQTGRVPIQIAPTGRKLLDRWEPLPAGCSLVDAAHYLPVEVYDTMMSLAEKDWMVTREKQPRDARSMAILRAAMAWGMVADGKGVKPRQHAPAKPSDIQILQALRRAGRGTSTPDDIRHAAGLLGWTDSRLDAASAMISVHEQFDEHEENE